MRRINDPRSVYKLFPYYSDSRGKYWKEIKAIPEVELVGLSDRLINDKMVIMLHFIKCVRK